MKQLILVFILIFNINIALSESSKDSLSKDVLNVTLIGELNKNVYDTYYLSFKNGIGLGLELEYHISKKSVLSLVYLDQHWLGFSDKSDYFDNRKVFYNSENQKLGIIYSYKYVKSDNSQIFFSLGPTYSDFEGVVDNYKRKVYIDTDFIGFNDIGADLSIMVRNKLNDNLYYNIGGRINIVSVSDLIVNLGAFVSITYKLI